MYEAQDDKLQPFFGRENIQLHCMECESFVLSIRTQIIIDNLKNLDHFLT